ncbi:RING finger protein 8 [Mycena venus]|uniref:RING finger protein 8 n=1 Tax=Mycena venus TaxID=2733690 RepID=A0A8H7CL46_9AGAR|nr:RING finger protein 8 [Mycena venus]
MHIEFSPALGETVHVSAGRTRQPTTLLHFTATLKSSTDHELASGRVKLQVWSDIPGSGRNAGEWGETEFKPVSPLLENGLLLLPPGETPQEKTSLTLAFSIPVSDYAQRFSFTYRMVYPNGHIEWLGQYGHNGTLVLDWMDSGPVILNEDWVPTPEGDLYRRNSDGRAVQDSEVARLSRPSEYIPYPVGEKSFLYHRESSLIVLVPRLSSHRVIVPPTLVFGATPLGPISFTPRGTITMSGTSSLSFTACETPEETERAVWRVIDPSSSPRFRVVSHSPGVVVLASAADKYLVEVAIVPIACYTAVVQTSLNLQNLASLISGKSPFFIFSSPRRSARFVEEDLDEKINVTAGQTGGAAEGLPTPPPSPRLRPLPHRDSEALVSQSPDPSFLSLPAAISSEGRPASPSSSQLIVHSASKRRGLLAMIGRIFVVLLNWFARLFGRRRVELPSKRTADEQTPLLQEQPRVEVSEQDPATQPASSSEQCASGISVDIDGGATTILFKAAHPTSSLNIPLHLNGRNIDFNEQKLGDGLFVVEFSSTTGGSLKIF